jgi:predicted flap endonuclease-1-like 5' DNA nuclease
MTITRPETKCTSTCWYVAVGLGLLLAVVLIAVAGWSFVWGLLLGVVAFLVLGFVLPPLVCTEGRADRPFAATSSPSSMVAGDPPAPAPTTPAAAAAGAGPAARTAPAQLAPKAAPIPEQTKRPATDDAPDKGEAHEKPETLSAPRAGGADDLKLIKGIGPKLEAMLNGMGFYHFDQIANWTGAEVAWVDSNLIGFKGRASRDEWVRQAAILARGEATEFSSRAAKGAK